jgi:hypothetical protein
VQVTDTAGTQTIISKWNATTGAEAREWRISLTSLEKLKYEIYDETNNVTCYTTTDAALTVGYHHIAVYYNCAGGATALNGANCVMYVDGATVAETPVNDGSYVQMRDTTSQAEIAANMGASTRENYFAGDIGSGLALTHDIASDNNIYLTYLFGKAYLNP